MIYSKKWAYGSRSVLMTLLLSLVVLVGYAQYTPGQTVTVSTTNNNTATGFTTTHVLTDNSGNIIQQVSGTSPVSFTAPNQSGTYRVYAVNYDNSGTAPTLTPGTNIGAIGGTCVATSSSPVTFSVNGSCVTPGTAINFTVAGNNTTSGYTTQYVLTDGSGYIINNNVTSPVTAPNQSGTFKVYAVNYNTGGTAPTLTPGTNINAIGGACTAVSSNPLEFCVTAPCVSPNTSISFTSSSNSNPGYSTRYVKTDASGQILDNNVSSPVNVGTTAGDFKIYAVNYSGTAPTMTPGTNISSVTGSCVDVSDSPLEYSVCTSSTVSGTIFHDPDGGNVNNSTGGANSVPAGLYVNLVDNAGNIVATAPVNTDGSYSLPNVAAGQYTLQLSTTQGTVGSPAPATSLPSGWVNTGEYNGAPNSGNDGTPNGISAPFTVSAGNSVANVNFGIEQTPTADGKTYTLASAPVAGSTINLSAGGNASNGSTPGNLTGTDPEDGVLNSTTAPYGVVIHTLPTNGTLLYDGTPITTSNYAINNYDPTKLTFQFTGTGYNSTSFTYSVVDKAGKQSPTPATYQMQWDEALPVTLVSFNAKAINTVAQLTWASSVETNTDRFEIQTSTDAERWQTLGQVKAAGGSTSMKYYAFTHAQPAPGINYYRLKMIDLDQTFAFSRTVSVEFDKLMAKSLVYPNPVSDVLQLGGVELSRVSKVELINGQGRVLYSAPEWSPEGLKVTAYPNGVYLLKLSLTDGSAHTHKVLIAR